MSNTPKFAKGILDIKDWDFETQGMIHLKGEWGLFLNQYLLDSKGWITSGEQDGFLYVPGNWKKLDHQKIQGRPEFGYMTLHVEVQHRFRWEDLKLVIYIPQVRSAASLFSVDEFGIINLMSKTGELGTTRNNYKPWFGALYGEFKASEKTDIYLQIANFDDAGNQGVYNNVYIGTIDQINELINRDRQVDSFTTGMISFAGILMLLLFSLRRTEIAPLWLGLFSLTMALRIFVVNLYAYEWLNDTRMFSTLLRINYFTLFFTGFTYAAFLRSTFPRYFSRRFMWSVSFATAIFVIITLFSASYIFTFTLFPYFFGLLCLFVWIIIGQTRALLNRKDVFSLMAFLGAFFIIAAAGLDIVSRVFSEGTINSIQFGFTLNILCMSAIVAVHNVRERGKAEKLTKQLSHEISIRTNAEEEIQLLNRQLSDRLHHSTTRLKDVEKKLAVTEQRSEMADITTGTLHNVKNVMNNIKVSAELLKESQNSVFVEGFKKATEMLKENLDAVEEFITKDARGKKLLEYYVKLESILDEESGVLGDNVARILEKVAAIEQIIDAQQRYGGLNRMEMINPSVVLQDALNMQMGAIRKFNIEVTKQFSDVDYIRVDKIKLLHILLNLIKNASEAMLENQKDNRKLTLITTQEFDSVIIKVKDKGHGISQNHLQSMFTRGFTTKKEGHGFGLNSSKLYMNEMGGEITVESEGVNRGATFVLKFPAAKETSDKLNSKRSTIV